MKTAESDSGYRKGCVIAWDTLDCAIVVARCPDQAGSATGQEYIFMNQGIERLEWHFWHTSGVTQTNFTLAANDYLSHMTVRCGVEGGGRVLDLDPKSPLYSYCQLQLVYGILENSRQQREAVEAVKQFTQCGQP